MVLTAEILPPPPPRPGLVFSLLQKFISGIFQDFHSWEGTSPAQEGKTTRLSLNSFMHFLIYPFNVQQAFVGGLLGAGHYTMSWGYSSKQTKPSALVAVTLAETEIIVTLKIISRIHRYVSRRREKLGKE